MGLFGGGGSQPAPAPREPEDHSEAVPNEVLAKANAEQNQQMQAAYKRQDRGHKQAGNEDYKPRKVGFDNFSDFSSD